MKFKLTLLLVATFTFLFSFGQIKLEDLKVDTTITGFHFAADFQGTNIFTKNGASDIQTINPTAFSFTIAPGISFTDAKDQLEQLLNMSKQGGYIITDIVKMDTTLNGNKAYYISYIETDDKNNYKNFVFNAFVIKDNTLILFTSGDLDNGQYADKFKKTFYTIKI
jgi:hypothetical protein